MTPERWRKVEALFHAVVESDGEQRAALLGKAAADDPAVWAEVEAMLAAHDAADGFGSKSVVRTNGDSALEVDIQPDPHALCEGSQVGGYRVLKRIGRGGMGTVWLAEHIALGRRAALKMLHPELSVRADVVTRFFNEARAATTIADPGIVQVFDFGKHVDGRAYIVMELLEGEPLNRRLKRDEPLSLHEGMRLMRQVASTIGAAHARGIVHRDLKPANIYIVRDPEVPGGVRAKVLDFGIAKLVCDEPGVETQTTGVIGTPSFMSPEQCRGTGQVDQRSDVYSLGCVLFTLIAGRPPFVGDGAGDIIAMHLRETPPKPSMLCPTTPPEIDALVLRCLAKDREQRFSNAGELAAAIDALLGAAPQLQTARASGHSPVGVTTLSAANSEQLSPVRRLRITLTAAIAAVAAGVIAIILLAISDDRHFTRAQTSANPTEPGPTRAPLATLVVEPVPAAPTAPTPPPAPPPPPAPAPRDQVASVMKEALARFVAWSADHTGAPCPGAAALGAPIDPWGNPLVLTCSEQPTDQIAGATSAGPDGQLGTADDVASWELGREVVDIVRKPARPVSKRRSPSKQAKSAKPPAKPVHVILLDQEGLPTTR